MRTNKSGPCSLLHEHGAGGPHQFWPLVDREGLTICLDEMPSSCLPLESLELQMTQMSSSTRLTMQVFPTLGLSSPVYKGSLDWGPSGAVYRGQ